MMDFEGESSQRGALDQIRRLQQDVETLKRQLIVPSELRAAIANAAQVDHSHAIQLAGMMFYNYLVIKSWNLDEGLEITMPGTDHVLRVYSIIQGAITHALTVASTNPLGFYKIAVVNTGSAYEEDLTFNFTTGKESGLIISALPVEGGGATWPGLGAQSVWIHGDHGVDAAMTSDGTVIFQDVFFNFNASFDTFVLSWRNIKWRFIDCVIWDERAIDALFINSTPSTMNVDMVRTEVVIVLGGSPLVLFDCSTGGLVLNGQDFTVDALDDTFDIVNHPGAKPVTIRIENSPYRVSELSGNIIYSGSGVFELRLKGVWHHTSRIDTSGTTRANGQHLVVLEDMVSVGTIDLARTKLFFRDSPLIPLPGAGSFGLRFRTGGSRGCTAHVSNIGIVGASGAQDDTDSGILVDSGALTYNSRFHNIYRDSSSIGIPPVGRIKRLLDGVPAQMVS